MGWFRSLRVCGYNEVRYLVLGSKELGFGNVVDGEGMIEKKKG